MTPVMKPFSSILYVCATSTSYCLIFSSRSLKYDWYFSAESALWRRESMAEFHCNEIPSRYNNFVLQQQDSRPFCPREIWLWCLLMKRVTQLSETPFWATDDAKFCIISLIGGKRRSVSCFIYFKRSSSCCGLIFCWSVATASRERVSPLCRRVRVERTTPCFLKFPYMVLFHQGLGKNIKLQRKNVITGERCHIKSQINANDHSKTEALIVLWRREAAKFRWNQYFEKSYVSWNISLLGKLLRLQSIVFLYHVRPVDQQAFYRIHVYPSCPRSNHKVEVT